MNGNSICKIKVSIAQTIKPITVLAIIFLRKNIINIVAAIRIIPIIKIVGLLINENACSVIKSVEKSIPSAKLIKTIHLLLS
jgi:hypothetical protein